MAHQNKSELTMSDYRRVYIPGGVYFFTVVTHNRNPILTHQDARITLRKAWLSVLQEYPFELIALCLLPDHIHCLWKLPESDSNYSLRWQRIKGYFSKHINKNGFNIPIPSHKYLSLGVYKPDWGYMEPASTAGLKSTGE